MTAAGASMVIAGFAVLISTATAVENSRHRRRTRQTAEQALEVAKTSSRRTAASELARVLTITTAGGPAGSGAAPHLAVKTSRDLADVTIRQVDAGDALTSVRLQDRRGTETGRASLEDLPAGSSAMVTVHLQPDWRSGAPPDSRWTVTVVAEAVVDGDRVNATYRDLTWEPPSTSCARSPKPT